jgi:hypothetical protein
MRKEKFPLMLFSFMLISIFMIACGDDPAQKNDPETELKKRDTSFHEVGCISEKEIYFDTTLLVGESELVLSMKNSCTDLQFFDTTFSTNGKDDFISISTYNYYKTKISFILDRSRKEFDITNESLKETLSDDFYERGIIWIPEVVSFSTADTSVILMTKLSVPGDVIFEVKYRIFFNGKLEIVSGENIGMAC